MYLDDKQRPLVAEFLSGPLGLATRAALRARIPAFATAGESNEAAAQRAFERKGYEQCLQDLRLITTETPPEGAPSIPSSLLDPAD